MTDKSKTESKEEKRSEWTFSKTITRIIGYLLSLFLLWMAITNLFSSTSSEKGLLGEIIIILLALIYPISDMLILLGKNKGDK